MKTQPTVSLDPRRFNASCLPADWYVEEASSLGAAIYQYLAHHFPEKDHAGDLQWRPWANQCFQGIRDTIVRADGLTIDGLLSRPEIPSAISTIESIGATVFAVRSQRAQLVSQIAALDAIEEMFSVGQTPTARRR